jgi:hypothetical protein
LADTPFLRRLQCGGSLEVVIYMADNPRGRPPSTPSGRNKGLNRGDEGRRDSYGGERGNTRDGGYADRAARYGRREQRSANPQTSQRRAVHYQVVTMDDDEWGDTLEHRLNSLGHEGWRLVAIDEGRQYVFVQTD